MSIGQGKDHLEPCTGYVRLIPFSFFQSIIVLVDQRNAVNLAYVDFVKMFDQISHFILMVKIVMCGLYAATIRWVWGWLNYQTQRVDIDRERSLWRDISS